MTELNEILNTDQKTYIYKDKEYIIKPMNIVQIGKVFKLIPFVEIMSNPTNGLVKMISEDIEKVIDIAHISTNIDKKIIENMMINDVTDLLKTIVEVNKPSFFLAWEKIKGDLEKVSKQSGEKQSKHLSAKDID